MSNQSARARFSEKLNRKNQNTEETFTLTAPSEMEYVVRRPNLQTYALSGVLPVSLTSKLQSLKSKGHSDEQVFQELNSDQQEKLFNFSRMLIKDICVSPRVVDTVTDEDNEISFFELSQFPDDISFLTTWAQPGGNTAALDNFRGSQSPVAGADS